jgi:hypothetical protein
LIIKSYYLQFDLIEHDKTEYQRFWHCCSQSRP